MAKQSPIKLYDQSVERKLNDFLLSLVANLRQKGNPAAPSENDLQVRDRLKRAFKELSYREREILKLRYGFGDGLTYTLEEVGHIFRVTRERIRQIEAKAIGKLQAALANERNTPA